MNAFFIGAGATLLGVLLNLILKKFVTDENIAKWSSAVEKVFFGIGRICTVGASHWKVTKGVWNSVIEPYVIIVLRAIVMNMLSGFIRGLLTDKPSMKKEKK